MNDEELKMKKRNLICYPLGTVGRDAIYQLFTSYVMTFILFVVGPTDAQFMAITAIMVAARIFDAANDPIMGYIIERTHTKWGKFKPWLAIGVVSTAAVVIAIFNSKLQGWAFVIEFGVIYFLYSITYTMNDISYWGMIPALSSDADTRNQFTSRAVLFAGIGGTLASVLIPALTTGNGINTQKMYGIISIFICILAIAFICITLFGVKEPHLQTKETMSENAKKNGLKDVIKTIVRNKQLLWIVVIFLIQQIGNSLILSGIGSTYVYFQYGYNGTLYSEFQTIGMLATAVLMVTYPMISRKIHRKPLMSIMMIISTVGYVLMIVAGTLVNSLNATLGFWTLTIGFMFSNFGQYCFYLVMMISVMNTVEYNEYISGNREEAIITSVRPFLTKLASALIIAIQSLFYLIFKVTTYTNQISAIERSASMKDSTMTAEEKTSQISNVLAQVTSNQKLGLLLAMCILPLVLMFISYLLYKKKYTLDEEEYDRICKVLNDRKVGTTEEIPSAENSK